MVAIVTAHPQKTILKTTAFEEVIKLALNVVRKSMALSFQRGFERRVVLLDQLIK